MLPEPEQQAGSCSAASCELLRAPLVSEMELTGCDDAEPTCAPLLTTQEPELPVPAGAGATGS